MLQKLRGNSQGFTLIELMIVIGIIGILASIAIPNFINYRNKSYCSQAESDANNVAGALADYFTIPSHIAVPEAIDQSSYLGISMSGKNTVYVAEESPGKIAIEVTDGSGSCPENYQRSSSLWNGGIYTKAID